MKISHYDVLQVSAKALPAVIEAAYQNLKPVFSEAARGGDQEARNQLVFLEEAYSVLSSPEKRSLYDATIASEHAAINHSSSAPYSFQSESALSSNWFDSTTGKLLAAAAIFAAVFSGYKFMGKTGEQKILSKQVDIQEVRELGQVRNDSYRAENERMLVQGVVKNQDRAIERSYDVATREDERRRTETESQANARAKGLELQQQHLDAQLQQQRWAQEQYEKERQIRDERMVADAPRKQLCSMYALNGKTQEARAAGCYSR